MTKPNLRDVEARAGAATEGPWFVIQVGQGSGRLDRYDVMDRLGPIAQYLDADTDATFIAASRTDVPALTEAIRAVLAAVESAEVATEPFVPFLDAAAIRAALSAHVDLD